MYKTPFPRTEEPRRRLRAQRSRCCHVALASCCCLREAAAEVVNGETFAKAKGRHHLSDFDACRDGDVDDLEPRTRGYIGHLCIHPRSRPLMTHSRCVADDNATSKDINRCQRLVGRQICNFEVVRVARLRCLEVGRANLSSDGVDIEGKLTDPSSPSAR